MERRKFIRHAGLAGVLATGVAPAVQAQATIKWRLTSSFPKSLDTIYGGAVTIANRVSSATGGKFQIQVFAAGEIAPGLQALDVTQNGTVEACHTCSYYYVGKNKAFGFGTAVPFGLNARQMNAWFYAGGGDALLQEFYNGYGVKHFLAGNTGVQMGGWFRKEMKSLADVKGMKMRIAGLGGEVFATLGLVPQQVAGSDIYPALEKGTIDAAEWVGPYDDEKLGFYKVAKNYYFPGWWEAGPGINTFINNAAWSKLPKDYQAILQAACAEANGIMMADYDSKNPAALQRLVNNGVKLRRFPDDVMNAAYKATLDFYSSESAKNPAFKKLYAAYLAQQKIMDRWMGVAEASMESFMRARAK